MTPWPPPGRSPATARSRRRHRRGRRPMAEAPANGTLEVLLDYLRRSRGFDFTGYKRTSLSRRVQQAHAGRRGRHLPELPGPPRGRPRRVHPAVQHHPAQRDQLLPGPADLGLPERRGHAPAGRRQGRRRADPGLERRLRLGRGGLHPGHGRRRGPRGRGGAGAGQDLRHRRRRGGARPGPSGPLRRQAGRRGPARAAGALLRAQRGRATCSPRTCGGRSSSAATT